MLHVGTLLAVVVYLRKDIWKMVQGTREMIRNKEVNPSARLFLWIILATIPTGLMGVFLKGWFESLFSDAQSGWHHAPHHRGISLVNPDGKEGGTKR